MPETAKHDDAAVRFRGDFPRTALARGYRNNAAIADALGVSQSTVGRLLKGDTLPSNTTIARTRRVFDGLTFDDLFEVVDQ